MEKEFRKKDNKENLKGIERRRILKFNRSI